MSWHEEAAIRREQERFVDQYQARSDAERSARRAYYREKERTRLLLPSVTSVPRQKVKCA